MVNTLFIIPSVHILQSYMIKPTPLPVFLFPTFPFELPMLLLFICPLLPMPDDPLTRSKKVEPELLPAPPSASSSKF